MGRRLIFALFVFGLPGWSIVRADDFEREPISYSKAKPKNAITSLQERIDQGQAKLHFDKDFGYLPAVLRELNVPTSSQTLVFSKTSVQRQRISPSTPRALYFNDDTYVGYCQFGPMLEFTAVDPELGAVFYTLEQEAKAKPRFLRQTDACLLCHGSSQTRGVPGHLVRSVFPDGQGLPNLAMGTFRIDQTSPLARRWGGWYVSGTHGKQTHLGNIIFKGNQEPDAEQLAKLGGLNCASLKNRFDTSGYLTPHSDIVALMVLEHQAEMQNLLTRANFLTRQALYDEAALNRDLGRNADYRSETTYHRIWNAAKPLVRYLLFSGEAKLTEPIAGTSTFAVDFSKLGPRDRKGRSLRDLDLNSRVFRYPCSYLIYSASFEALHPELKSHVLRCVHDVLIGRDSSRDFEHLSAADRQAILEILRATKKDLPRYWRG